MPSQLVLMLDVGEKLEPERESFVQEPGCGRAYRLAARCHRRDAGSYPAPPWRLPVK